MILLLPSTHSQRIFNALFCNALMILNCFIYGFSKSQRIQRIFCKPRIYVRVRVHIGANLKNSVECVECVEEA